MDRLTLISLSLLVAACGVGVLTLPLLRDWRQRRLAARTIDGARYGFRRKAAVRRCARV